MKDLHIWAGMDLSGIGLTAIRDISLNFNTEELFQGFDKCQNAFVLNGIVHEICFLATVYDSRLS